MKELKHIGIIMDGNGRWAESRGLQRKEGHKQGAKVCMDIIHSAIDSKIEILSLYAFSTENWSRPEDEVFSIMDIFNLYLENEILDFLKRGVNFRVVGDRSKLSMKTRFLINNAERLSSKNKGMKLLLAVNYGGQDDIIRGIKKLAKNNFDFKSIETSDLDKILDTRGLPAVDLIIRTSGEQRLSNFMVWQAAYAEYFFTDTLWPDFSAKEFQTAINSFGLRNRRFGDVSDTVQVQEEME